MRCHRPRWGYREIGRLPKGTGGRPSASRTVSSAPHPEQVCTVTVSGETGSAPGPSAVSNRVINLSTDKPVDFAKIFRALAGDEGHTAGWEA